MAYRFLQPVQHPIQSYNYFDKILHTRRRILENMYLPYWDTNKRIFSVGQQRSHLLNREKI